MPDDRLPVLVLGGYGVFGGNVARMLARDDLIRVVIGGRSSAKAAAFVRDLRFAEPGCDAVGVGVDIASGIASALAETGARLVIHAAGPFQGQDYRVAETCIEAGVDYIDLADGRAFVEGFAELDEPARRAGTFAVTGASSVPGLSSAAVDHLASGMSEIHRIAIGITPGNQAPRGRAVIEAILGGVGNKMQCWQDGRMTEVRTWSRLHRRALRLPDGSSIGNRWFAAWDVPDLALFPSHYGVRDTVRFYAGLELKLMHFGLWALSFLVRAGVVRSLRVLTPILHGLSDMLKPFGTDRGGMFVEVAGADGDGGDVQRRWTLIAGSGDGPQVPSIPAVILARKRARRALGLVGAKPCAGLFSLAEFDDAVGDLDIRCGVEELPVR